MHFKVQNYSVYKIKKEASVIKEYAEQLRITDGNGNRISRKSPANVELEKRLHKWFIKNGGREFL